MFNKIFKKAIELKASDIHLSLGHYPFFRINQDLRKIKSLGKINNSNMYEILNKLGVNQDLDYYDGIYLYEGFRLRYNLIKSNRSECLTMRIIPKNIPSFKELNLPEELNSIFSYDKGLIIISGKTCSGKSTTLAAVINEINKKCSKKIIVFEDPIEYIYPDGNSLIIQKDISNENNLSNILKSVVRMDPDIIVVSEIRDIITLRRCVELSELGHLVFATLHAGSISETIKRVVDMYDSSNSKQIRYRLSTILNVIIHQSLFKGISGLVPILEIWNLDKTSKNIIKLGKDENFIKDQINFLTGKNGTLAKAVHIKRMFNLGLLGNDEVSLILSAREIENFTNINYN